MTRKNLVRTRGGSVIHRATCRHRQRLFALQWLWADDVSWQGVQAAAAALGLKACGVCRPFDELTSQEATEVRDAH